VRLRLRLRLRLRKNILIMRKIAKVFITVLIGVIVLQNNADNNSYENEILDWQNELNIEFKNPKTSPLTDKDISRFTKLDFYKIDEDYKVEADLTLNNNQQEFGMKTTTDRLPVYVKYGVASFNIKGKKFKMNIYRNVELSKREKYKDYLFMLFNDKTSGTTSYAGGRYIDLRIPNGGEKLHIDFNKAYNPYCAYNHKYSCPIPPEEDYLDIEILAGVKAFH